MFTVSNDILASSQPQIQGADPATIQQMVKQLEVGGDTKDILLTVSTKEEERALWIMEGEQWVEQSDIPEECQLADVCFGRVSDGIVVAGGEDDDYTVYSQCHHFSVHTRQWKKLHDMPTARFCASAVEVEEMRLMVVGGVGSNWEVSAVCEIIDIVSNKWTSAAPLPTPMGKPLVAAAAGRAFILPQYNMTPSTRILMYDPSTDTHTHRSQVPDNVRDTWGACLVAVAQKLYLLGGEERLAVQYDPRTNQWVKLTPPTAMYTGYHGCCAVVKSHHIMVCGGDTEGRYDSNRIDEYNTTTGEWRMIDMRLPCQFDMDDTHVAIFRL